jgi:hypothetical protein
LQALSAVPFSPRKGLQAIKNHHLKKLNTVANKEYSCKEALEEVNEKGPGNRS